MHFAKSHFTIGLSLTISLGVLALPIAPAFGRDALGVFGNWGAFLDEDVPRCYAIATPEVRRSQSTNGAFASIGTWPEQEASGQFYIRLTRNLSSRPNIRLNISGEVFLLSGEGREAWAKSAQQDNAIRAALRNGSNMSISASNSGGGRFTDRYSLSGVATAMDAANIACSSR